MSNVSLTPAGGWYADPMDAAQLRWWDGANWTRKTTPAVASDDAAPTTGPVAPVTPIAPLAPEPAQTAPEPMPPAADAPGVYIPRNSVFKMADAVDGQAYVPEWSGIGDISDEVALSGVPVQLALTSAPTDGPPIPVSADAFPVLGFESETTQDAAPPPWKVEEPLAKPVDQLFPTTDPPVGGASAKKVDAFLFAGADPFAPITSSAAPTVDAAFAPAVSPTAPPVSPTDSAAMFADIFPNVTPASVTPTNGPVVAPAPTGAIFPGLVPSSDEPATGGPAQAPVVVPVLAAVPEFLPESPAADAPVAAPPIPQAAPVIPVVAPALPFALPEPDAVPSESYVPAPAPAAGYEPLVARAIPQPVSFAPAPTSTPAPAPAEPEPVYFAPTAAPVQPEAAWPSAGTYQPHPGAYVPFDPNAVRVEEAPPAIPFSSRDPFNAASTSRPGLRSYGSAPVGPSGSTYTGALVMILLTPLLIAGGYALLFQLNAINVGLAPNLALDGLLVALFFIGIGAAQFDRNTLAKRGYFDLASPFWILLSPLVYLGVRASRLRPQGSGGVRAVLLWFLAWAGAAAILTLSTFSAMTAVTPERVVQTQLSVAQHLTVGGAAPSVQCPSIPSYTAGTVFNCTATSATTVQLVQVTVTDWLGGESYRIISTSPVTAPAPAAAPTAP